MIYLDSAATTMQKPRSVGSGSGFRHGDHGQPRTGRAQAGDAGCGGHVPVQAAGGGAVPRLRPGTCDRHLQRHPRAQYRDPVPGASRGTVVISGYEHNAVTRPLAAIPDGKIRVASAPLFDRDGVLDAFDRAMAQGADGSDLQPCVQRVRFVQPWKRSPPCAHAERSPSCWMPRNRRAPCLWIWRLFRPPISPCRDTRGSMAPRGPVCCCVGKDKCRCRCSRAGQAACPPSRTCRDSCRTGWRRGPRTSPARRD